MPGHDAASRQRHALAGLHQVAFCGGFFALESAYNDSVVYALNTPVLWHRVPRFDASLTRHAIDPRVPQNFEKYFFNNHLPLIWFGEPSEMDQRLIAQSGLFVVPGQLEKHWTNC